MKEFLKVLDGDKIKINWNKEPIKMELFLSFLTVETERQSEFLGASHGWTLLTGPGGLEIGGGIIKGVEYLNRILYGKHLDNVFNNYVNPFYLFNIFTEEGKAFFFEYYAEDINAILKKAKASAIRAKINKEATFDFWKSFGFKTSEIEGERNGN